MLETEVIACKVKCLQNKKKNSNERKNGDTNEQQKEWANIFYEVV